MFSGIYRSLAILVTIVAFYGMDFVLISRYDRQRKAAGSGRSWDFTLLIFLASAMIVIQPVLISQLGLDTLHPWGLLLQVAGILVVFCSLALHAWARFHLRQFYAERVEVQPGHRLVDSGPYAIVRHPVITSFFGLVSGLFLINPAVPTLLVMAYTFWDFSRAARQEEQLLSQTLPDYPAYMERTPPFLPCLWRRK